MRRYGGTMTQLVFFTSPILLAFPLGALITASLCAFFSKYKILTYISGVIHAVAIVMLFMLGGNLADVFVMLAASVAASLVTEIIKKKKCGKEADENDL